jgi:hypothetical protein
VFRNQNRYDWVIQQIMGMIQWMKLISPTTDGKIKMEKNHNFNLYILSIKISPTTVNITIIYKSIKHKWIHVLNFVSKVFFTWETLLFAISLSQKFHVFLLHLEIWDKWFKGWDLQGAFNNTSHGHCILTVQTHQVYNQEGCSILVYVSFMPVF